MDAATERSYQNPFPLPRRVPATKSSDLSTRKRKRVKADEGGGYNDNGFPASWRFESECKRNNAFADHSDPFSINNMIEELDSGKFGSVTKDIMELVIRRRQLLDSFYVLNPELPSACFDVPSNITPKTSDQTISSVIELDDDQDGCSASALILVPAGQSADPVVIIDSDDETDSQNGKYRSLYLAAALPKPSPNLLMKDFAEWDYTKHDSVRLVDIHIASETESINTKGEGEPINSKSESEPRNSKSEIVSSDDEMEEESDGELSDANDDGLGGIWNELSVALECSKDVAEDALLHKHDAGDEECVEHSFILKDDIGEVCRVCGIVKRSIDSIIEYNFSKGTKGTRTYSRYEGRNRSPDSTELLPEGLTLPDNDFAAAEIYPHPRHRKEMKPHQIEGFNFLVSNLVSENPGGCIMAHAPGSGKTFMIISFLQSFMAKYPAARPLVVLPRGILPIWKKEFIRWQVEDIPLLDCYSVKADSRAQQLEVLKEWVQERSILFLGYKQFSSIVCDTDDGHIPVACQNYLLKVPSILILDEGHTPRNQDTDVLTSLERVETTRKVVLSGTLYQNHVREVFNILNLVRPKFLKMETSKTIRRRIWSKAEISDPNMKLGRDSNFYEVIERSLIKDKNLRRKETIIQDLREMTRKVLHYYKGDNLDELPGLVDFSVFLRLSPKQKSEVKFVKSLTRKFTISAQGSAIYVHPKLKSLASNSGVKDRVDEEKIDALLESLDVRDGAKLNFYLNLLQLCESNGEKLLVFSQYLLPLKFLERITGKIKGYGIGREMFMITGDSDIETRETFMEKFNTSSEARVFFGSIKACGEGITLVGASRIIILDVHLNPSVTRQAIGRAFRPGQVRKVYTYRLIAADSPEEEDHGTCFKKESIAKVWFEWDECSGRNGLELETVDVNDCGDMFLETARLNENVVALYRR